MDPITQGALGGAAAIAASPKRHFKNACIIGILAGLAPDLDILIRSDSSPLLSLYYHRHFTHSLIFILPGAFLVSLFLLLSKRFRPIFWFSFYAATIGYATHGILDACTSYGTLLFWPFSDKRVYFDWIAIINPFFTYPLCIGIAWSIYFKTRKGVAFGLLVALIVLAVNAYQDKRAVADFIKYANTKNLTLTRVRALPYLASSTEFRGVAIHEQDVIIADIYRPFIGKGYVKIIAKMKLFSENKLPSYVIHSKTLREDYNIFTWFADDYVVSLCDNPLFLLDGRYLFGNSPLTALWGVEFQKGHKHVEKFVQVPVTRCPHESRDYRHR